MYIRVPAGLSTVIHIYIYNDNWLLKILKHYVFFYTNIIIVINILILFNKDFKRARSATRNRQKQKKLFIESALSCKSIKYVFIKYANLKPECFKFLYYLLGIVDIISNL